MEENLKHIRRAYSVLVIATGLFSALMVFAAWYASNIAPRLISENYHSVQYATAMERAFMNLYLTESSSKSSDAGLIKIFEENLEKEKANITGPGEKELMAQLEEDWTEFKAQLRSPSPTQFQQILAQIQRCIEINEQKMFSLRDRAQNLGLTVVSLGVMFLSLALLYAVQYVNSQTKQLVNSKLAEVK